MATSRHPFEKEPYFTVIANEERVKQSYHWEWIASPGKERLVRNDSSLGARNE
jgi:hypothetical protein